MEYHKHKSEESLEMKDGIISNDEKNHKDYWNGGLNKLYRYWFYLNKGLDIFNQFKYLVAFIFGIYFTLKLKNAFWMLAMAVGFIPILLLLGYWSTHYFGKVLEWLSVRFSSHYSRATFELLENQLKELKEIKEKINESSLK